MKAKVLKSILKNHKELVRKSTKEVEVHGSRTVYRTLKNFGLRLLDLESKGYEFSMSVLKDHNTVNTYTTKEAIIEAFNKTFDEICIYCYKIDMDRAIQRFGTSA